jgi:adenylyltransferase/sulfurtransferase
VGISESSGAVRGAVSAPGAGARSGLHSGRYAKQVLFAGVGEDGQRRLRASRVLVAGCGALGSVVAEALARAGVGFLRIADRDFVEVSNLQRQQLFSMRDVAENLPKAEAARRRLAEINPEVEVEARVVDIDPGNVGAQFEGVDLVMDGSDNFELRYLLNDVAVERAVPWVYAGVLGSYGMTAGILPGVTGCLACLFPDAGGAGGGAPGTCETEGVLGTAVGVVAGMEATAALRFLAGGRDATGFGRLWSVDVWDGRVQEVAFRRDPGCLACGRREFVHLRAERGSCATSLCGRDAYQLRWREPRPVDLEALAARLAGAGEVAVNRFLLKFRNPEVGMTVFPDGRAIIEGAGDATRAREVYHRYVG